MSELDNLIGSSISLISQLDVRYDGILFSINPKEASIVLREVKCMGTEDRVTDATKKVSANDKVTPFVTFPGNEIKDLYVHEQQPSSSATTTSTPPTPPVHSGPPANKQTNKTEPPKPPSTETTVPQVFPSHEKTKEPRYDSKKAEDKSKQYPSSHSRDGDHGNKQQGRGSNNNHHHHGSGGGRGGSTGGGRSGGGGSGGDHERRHQERAQTNTTQTSTNVGTGEHLLKSREQRPVTGREPESNASVKVEFDFSAALKTFNKEAVLAEVASSSIVPVEVPKYNKDDFFDSFSNDKSTDGKGGRMTFAEERKLNQDTFGISSLRSNYRGGRGNGRGGRGRGGSSRGYGGKGYGSSGNSNNNHHHVTSSGSNRETTENKASTAATK